MATEIATHEDPSWGERADFLIFARLGEAGLEGRWEQLWARKTRDGDFEICCIPFFTYGIALGDVVRTTPAFGKTYVVADVTARSGRGVLRFWLKGATRDGRQRLEEVLGREGLATEWHSNNLVAVDVESSVLPENLDLIVRDASTFGIEVEWGSEGRPPD